MKKFAILFLLALTSFGLATTDADAAKRLGGGQSIGKQRDLTNRQQVAPQPPHAPAAAPAPAPAPAPSGGSKWLGPLAGLAAGGLLGAMFAGQGFGGGLLGALGSILMIALLIGAVLFLVRMLRRSTTPTREPIQYAGAGGQPRPAPVEPTFGGGAAPVAPVGPQVPPGFDTEGFLRSAKTSFIRLQAANDAKDLNDLRDFTTPELYAELSMQIRERGDEPQRTEVVNLNAELIDVSVDGNLALASVRFSGLIRETAGGPAEPFDEVWNVQKQLDQPGSVWLVAGIQQTR